MATKKITVDDFTGQAATNTASVEIMIGEETFTLDLAPGSLRALMALVRGKEDGNGERQPDTAPMAKLLGSQQTSSSGGSTTGSGTARRSSGASKPSSKAGSEVRQWLRNQGHNPSNQGPMRVQPWNEAFPDDQRDRFGNPVKAA